MDDPADNSKKQTPIGDLKISPEAEDLMASAPMQPYMNLALAVTGHKDVKPVPLCSAKSRWRELARRPSSRSKPCARGGGTIWVGSRI
jgi:hypothetical protein